jgi:hypothetical protein
MADMAIIAYAYDDHTIYLLDAATKSKIISPSNEFASELLFSRALGSRRRIKTCSIALLRGGTTKIVKEKT